MLEIAKNIDLLSEEAGKVLRPELFAILVKGKSVIRFTGPDIPKGAITDNVCYHSLRCFDIASRLGVPKLPLMMSIHDLPEIENLMRHGLHADMTAPEKKANPEKAKMVAAAETQVAIESLTPAEYHLYEEFEKGANYLKDPYVCPDNTTIPTLGVLGKIIDTVDACWVAHSSLAQWAKNPHHDIKEIQSDSLMFPYIYLNNFAVFANHIQDETLRSEGLELIFELFGKLHRVWDDVFNSVGQIPESIEEYI